VNEPTPPGTSDAIPPRPDRPRSPGEPPRPRSSWRWWEAIGVYLLAWLIGSMVTLPIFALVRPESVATIVASAAIAVVNVAVLLFWLSRMHPGWAAAIGFPSRAWPEVRAGVGFGLLLYPGIAFGVGLVVSLLLHEISGRTVTTPEQVPATLPPFGLVATVLYAVVIAPIHEELFFRGILFRSIRDRRGFGAGAAASAIAFGLVHYMPAPFVDSLLLMSVMVVTGFALAFFYERRGNIVASMIAHATFNTIGLVLIFWMR
jgi:membrane protease YdiL (CAAX protease family)